MGEQSTMMPFVGRRADSEVWGMWLTPKEVEVIGLMISLVSDDYHIAPTKPVHDDLKV